MTGLYIFISGQLFKAFYVYLFRRQRHASLYHSAVRLFTQQSFRLPESARHDALVIIKAYFNVSKRIFSQKPEFKTLHAGHIAALDSSPKGSAERISYLQFFKVDPSFLFSREHLSGSLSAGHAFLHWLAASFLALFLLPFSFSKHRANYALLLRESAEWANLLFILKKNAVTHLYFFSIYEKDSNFLTILLNKKNITVSKITSEVPLTFANKVIVADEICLCFGYQEEEVKEYRDTIFCKKINTWIPEMLLTYAHLYSGRTLRLPRNTIGFYSSACWLRKKLDHSLAAIGSYDAEEQLLNDLLDYVRSRGEYELLVFLHPLEKRNGELTREYYHELTGQNGKVRFAEQQIPSTQQFDAVNTGVSLFSTIMFERLSLGFKCILCPYDKKDFPLPTSPFRNICAYSKEELFAKLDSNMPYPARSFFEKNGISHYVSSHIHLDCELS